MDDRVVKECDTTAAIARGCAVSLVQEDMIDIVKDIVNDGPIRVLPEIIHSARDRARCIEHVVRARRVSMRVHKDVSLNPGIRAVQVEVIIRGSIKDVIDDLENRPGPIAAGEVDRIIEAPGVPKVVVPENSVASQGDAIDSMQALWTGWRWIGWEVAVLHDE